MIVEPEYCTEVSNIKSRSILVLILVHQKLKSLDPPTVLESRSARWNIAMRVNVGGIWNEWKRGRNKGGRKRKLPSRIVCISVVNGGPLRRREIIRKADHRCPHRPAPEQPVRTCFITLSLVSKGSWHFEYVVRAGAGEECQAAFKHSSSLREEDNVLFSFGIRAETFCRGWMASSEGSGAGVDNLTGSTEKRISCFCNAAPSTCNWRYFTYILKTKIEPVLRSHAEKSRQRTLWRQET